MFSNKHNKKFKKKVATRICCLQIQLEHQTDLQIDKHYCMLLSAYKWTNQNCWQILEAILRQTKHAVIILIMYGRRAEVAGAEANFRLVCITAPYPGLVGKYGHKVTEKGKFCNII